MIHILIGTKAQLIKMAPLMALMKNQGVPYNFIHTGQHHETITDLLSDFGLRAPDHTLYNGPDITSIAAMAKWGTKLIAKHGKHSPIWNNDDKGIVLVHGDTISALIGAVCAKRAGLKVAHIESGLRSFNLFHPFPEELTRLGVFRLSDILFCPGDWAASNVAHLTKKKVVNTGQNTLIDAIRLYLGTESRRDHLPSEPYVVISLHRFENIFNQTRLTWILDQLIKLPEHLRKVFIMHPPTEKKLAAFGLRTKLEEAGFDLRNRYGYLDFISLVSGAEFVVTDGGSNQEECSYLDIPCLIMRKSTERKEGLGMNAMLSNYDEDVIASFHEFAANYRPGGAATGEIHPSAIILENLGEYA